jgi:hypothetical protein
MFSVIVLCLLAAGWRWLVWYTSDNETPEEREERQMWIVSDGDWRDPE